jgi:hypothetical protein
VYSAGVESRLEYRSPECRLWLISGEERLRKALRLLQDIRIAPSLGIPEAVGNFNRADDLACR